MEIEIVEFYPYKPKGKKVSGTLHVYLIDLEMDIRGIHVSVTGKHWWFQMPYRVQYDHANKEEVRFPLIGFTDLTKHEAMMNSIREKGRIYIEKNFLKITELDNKDSNL